MSFRSTLLKTLVTLLALALGHYSYVETIGKTLYKGEDQNVTNSIKLENYLYKEQADEKALVVGTSLSAHARHPDLTNLSLTGGAALTVLEILASKRKLPAVILVESNFLYYETDQDLVEKFSSDYHERVPLLQYRYRPMSLILGGIATANSDVSDMVKVPSKSKINLDIRRKKLKPNLEAAEKEFKQEALRRLIGKLHFLIKEIEDKGTNLIFYETPFDPSIAIQPRHRQWKETLRKAFPKRDLHQVVVMNLETSDGIHLCLEGVLEMGEKLGNLAKSAKE